MKLFIAALFFSFTVLCSFTLSAFAEESVKEEAKDLGRAVKREAKEIGQTVKKGARKAKVAAKGVGQDIKASAKKAKRKILD